MKNERDDLGRFSKHNTFSNGLTTNGRPPVFSTPEDMEEKACEYFDSLIIDNEDGLFMKPSSICGVALYLGFVSRQSFNDYAKKTDFSDIVSRIKLAVENSYEKGLHSKGASGCQFALKNMGWKDKTEVEQETVIVDKRSRINFE